MAQITLHTNDNVTSWINEGTIAFMPCLFGWCEPSQSFSNLGIQSYEGLKIFKRQKEDIIEI